MLRILSCGLNRLSFYFTSSLFNEFFTIKFIFLFLIIKFSYLIPYCFVINFLIFCTYLSLGLNNSFFFTLFIFFGFNFFIDTLAFLFILGNNGAVADCTTGFLFRILYLEILYVEFKIMFFEDLFHEVLVLNMVVPERISKAVMIAFLV